MKVNPLNFSKMCMDQSQMEDVVACAIEQLTEKNRYDCYRDDLRSQYDDNVTTYWYMFVGFNGILLVALLVCIGYLLAREYWWSFYIFLGGSIIEFIVLYRGLRQLSSCIAISKCLSVIAYEKPNLLQYSYIRKLMKENGI